MNMQVCKDGNLPETGEWVLSPEPNAFVVTLMNDTPFFTQYDRLAAKIVIELLGDGDSPEKSKFKIGIVGLCSVDGKIPGEDIGENVADFMQAPGIQDRITAALDLWGEQVSDEERMDVWMSCCDDPMEVLSALIGQ